jgi:pilus assembly protein CpaB
MSANGEDGKPVVQRFGMVTLEATPKIAEKIAVAQTIGQLSLALRSIADNSAELERAIASGEVSIPENADPKAEKKILLAIAGKPVDSNTTYTVGADVSRFQRRSVPTKAGARSDPADKMANAIGSLAQAVAGSGSPAASSSSSASVPAGPVVRVARGNNVTVVPVGAK